ncbi:nucleoside deaminase [Arthrobacter sp. JSM 101049]|uniref:nucleoside deaminase n=1 Tax=Arthrobacter sp. JSM 101049 TaxID=929097 RepID=UPI0035684E8B
MAGQGTTTTDPHYAAALAVAEESLAAGGVPIGSALVVDGNLVATGSNRRVQDGDPTAHAEITCLRQAGRLTDYRGATLYTTLAPCDLCTGAVLLFGIPRVVVGEAVNFPGAVELLRARGVEVTILDDPRAADLMAGFIAERPDLWNEDIGIPDSA